MNFQEVFDSIKQTHYEVEHGIIITDKEIILDTIDIKLIKVGKSTGEFGLCIIYKTSTKYDTWTYWYPSGNQQRQLVLIAKLLSEVD